MHDRERLRQLVREGDVPATRALWREYRRSRTNEDADILNESQWVFLLGHCAESFDAWQQFAAMVLRFPDVDDYNSLNNAGRNHILGRDHADIMDAALGKIRRLLSIPEPFSIRGRRRR